MRDRDRDETSWPTIVIFALSVTAIIIGLAAHDNLDNFRERVQSVEMQPQRLGQLEDKLQTLEARIQVMEESVNSFEISLVACEEELSGVRKDLNGMLRLLSLIKENSR